MSVNDLPIPIELIEPIRHLLREGLLFSSLECGGVTAKRGSVNVKPVRVDRMFFGSICHYNVGPDSGF